MAITDRKILSNLFFVKKPWLQITVDIDIFEKLNDSGVAFIFNSLSKSGIYHCQGHLCHETKIHLKTNKCFFHQSKATGGPAFTLKLYSLKSDLCFCYGHLCYEIKGHGEKYRFRVYKPAGICGLDPTRN